MKKIADIQDLYQKFLEKRCSPEEAETLLQYIQEHPDSDIVKGLMQAELDKSEAEMLDYDDLETIAYNRLRLKQAILGEESPSRKKNWTQLLPYAAAILLFLSIGIYFYAHKLSDTDTPTLTSQYGDDVLPGTNKATILLADGSRYELDEHKAGVQVDEHGMQYEDGTAINTGSSISATIATPNGGQYRITLADGTKVMLNAATKLTYPTHFEATERKVILEGEAYFEVAKDAARPFIVQSNQQQIKVIGTSFNVQSYPHEQPTTTLVEGKVVLSLDGTPTHTVSLLPGQQAVLNKEKFHISSVSTEDYTSWLNNQFAFNNMPLSEAFAQLERWYDVRFDYPKAIVNDRIYANINRDRKLSDVLKTIEEIVKLQFTIEGRRVTVRK